MASKIAKGGGMGSDLSLGRARSPWAISRSILFRTSQMCSPSRWGSVSDRSAMLSLMSSINHARDVAPAYFSLGPLFRLARERLGGLAYTVSVKLPGDSEAGVSRISLAWSTSGVVRAVEAIGDSSQRRFSEFWVFNTDDYRFSVKKTL